MTGSFIGIALGVALGARHALEPDHLAAISVLGADRPGPRRGLALGALWGIGHAAALLGVALAVAALAAEIPRAVADLFELGVAAMLVGLGTRAVYRAARAGRDGVPTLHRHRAHGHAHRHAGPPAHVHVARRTLAFRPLAVGLVHGLAGSGALTAFAVARLPSTAARLAFIVLFGAGSILGMSAISGLAGWPLARVGRHPRTARLILGAAGALSATLGLVWGWTPAARLFG